MKVSRILSTKSTDVITIGEEATMRDVITLLARHNVGALPVMNEVGRLVGIISERDVIRLAARDESLFGRPVREVMTRKVITGVRQDDLISVAHTMTERCIRHLPIVEEGKLIGIISIGDVLKVQRDEYQGEIETLETSILADRDQ